MTDLKRLLRRCPICLCTQGEVLHHQEFVLPRGHLLSDGYDVVCCDECGFVFADTAINQDDYDRFYARQSKYEDQKTSSGAGLSWWDQQRLAETAKYIAACFEDPENSKMIDIGCANGGLLRELQQLGGKRLYGMDPSYSCVQNTRSLSIDAEAGSLFALPESLVQSYDCVILCHVLEHIYDLRRAVQQIDKLVAPQGLVYIEVPDAAHYAQLLVAPFQDFNTEHINHFDPTTLQNLFRLSGFETVDVQYKELLSSPSKPYPAVYAVFKKASQPLQPRITKSVSLREQMMAYIDRSQQMMARIDAGLRALLKVHPTIMVWGMGQLTMKLLADTALKDAQIAAFIDNNSINIGKTLGSVPVIGPGDIQGTDDPILIASLIHQEAIASQIKDLGLKNQVLYLLSEDHS